MKSLSTLPILLLAVTLLSGCDQSGTAEPENVRVVQWPLNTQCNLHKQPCTTQQGKQSVTLDVQPRPIPVAKPLGVTVTLKNISAKAIQLDIGGKNMYMGFNRANLKPTSPDRWVGTTMLAFCTNGKMEWQLTLLITLEDGSQIQVPYPLETSSRR
jgi:hypothetical protein